MEWKTARRKRTSLPPHTKRLLSSETLKNYSQKLLIFISSNFYQSLSAIYDMIAVPKLVFKGFVKILRMR